MRALVKKNIYLKLGKYLEYLMFKHGKYLEYLMFKHVFLDQYVHR